MLEYITLRAMAGELCKAKHEAREMLSIWNLQADLELHLECEADGFATGVYALETEEPLPVDLVCQLQYNLMLGR